MQNYLPLQSALSLSCCKASKRKATPFSDETPSRSNVRQCNESYEACSIIYGGSDGNKLPVLKGMLDTVSRRFKASIVSIALVSSKNAITQNSSKCFINTWQHEFYNLNKNRLRFLSIYYSQNGMGKNKYRAVRNPLFQNKRLANYLPYKELVKYISSLDIGMLKLFSPYIVETNELEDIPAGLFRDIKTYIQRQAVFYLKDNKCRSDKLF